MLFLTLLMLTNCILQGCQIVVACKSGLPVKSDSIPTGDLCFQQANTSEVKVKVYEVNTYDPRLAN